MTYEHITSRENKRVKFTSKLLSSSSFRIENGLFAVEGLRLCIDAVKSDYKPFELYFTKTMMDKHPDELNFLISASKDSFLTDDHVFSKMSDTVSPQGIMCVLHTPEINLKLETRGKYIMLSNIADPSNLGAISRTAEALGIDGLLVSGGCDIYNPKALRASMGALFRIGVISADESILFEAMAKYNIKSFASVPISTATPVSKCDFSGGAAILIGNEANGLSADTIKRCDETITIPMAGKAESLNAAAAASILMYEMVRDNTNLK